MCGPARNVCVCYGLWNPPTASLPNCISAPRVASWRKTPRISCHSSSCVPVPVGVVNLATCACVKSEEEGGEKTCLQYFEFGLQYLVQPLGVNPTYSTFKEDVRRVFLQGDLSVTVWDSQGWELFIMQANVKDSTSPGAAGLYESVL